MGKCMNGVLPLVSFLTVLFIFSRGAIEEESRECGNGPGSTGNCEENGHHIVKRASANAPDNVTITLKKRAPYQNTEHIYIGGRVAFELDIAFPDGTTDMNVELFTPDNDTTIMILCDVNVTHVGSSLTISGTKTPTMDSKTPGSKMHDRAVIPFDNVTNDGTCANLIDCTITVQWEAIMIDNNSTTNGSMYWVSAGAEYNDENEIWVGQASFMAISDEFMDDASYVPDFNFTGPDEMEIGSGAIFQIDMFDPYPSTELIFNAFTPLNTSSMMSVCSTRAKHVADNFKCGYDENAVATRYYPADTGLGNSIGQLTLGTMLNKGSRDSGDPQSNSIISVQFAMHLYNEPQNVGKTVDVGAAFELSGKKIWAGKRPVKLIASSSSSAMENVNMTFVYDDDKIQMGVPKNVELQLSIPENTTSVYELTIEAPFNDSKAVFQLCSVTVGTVGINMGCVTNDKTATYSSRESGSSFSDKAVFSLGGITNLAFEDHNINPNASIITFDLVVNAMNHSLATVGSKHNVLASVSYAGGRSTVAYLELEVNQDSNPANANVTAPNYNMTGPEEVEIGASARVIYEIDTAENVSYPAGDVELFTPSSNTTTLFSLCRAKVLSVGKNLPCVTKDYINSKVTYTSKFNDGINNRAAMNLGSVCNIQFSNDTDDNKILIAMDFNVLEVADSNNDSTAVAAGNMFSGDKIWIGQLNVKTKRTGSVIPATAPHVGLVKNTTNTLSKVPFGYVAVYTVLIKIPPGESVDLKVEVTSSQNGLYVCGMRVVDTGDNLPCVKKDIIPTFTPFSSSTHNEKGVMDFNFTSNTGTDKLVSNDVYDSNTLLVEVDMRLSDDTSLVSEGGSLSFQTDVYYSTTSLKKTITETLTATANTSIVEQNITKSATYNFTIGDIGDDDGDTPVAKEEAKRFLLDIYMPELETQDVTVRFLTPVLNPGYMEVCGAAVIEIGSNFPCMDKTKIDATLEKRAGSNYNDIATLKLGYVRNTALSTTDPDNSRIRLEAVAKVLNHPSLAANSKVKFHVAVNTNDMQIYVSEVELTITDTFVSKNNTGIEVNETLLFVNSTDSVLSLKVNENMTIPVVANVPPMTSSQVKFDVDFQINGTAYAIVKDIRLVNTGSNIACLYEDSSKNVLFTPKFTKWNDTCIAAAAEVDFGIVTNPGLTHRQGTYEEGHNSLSIEVDVVVIDYPDAENNDEFDLSFGIKEAIYIAICNKKAKVTRTGNEKPELEITADLNATSTTSKIYVDIVMNHKNSTTARGIDTFVQIYKPEYMQFSGIVSSTSSQNPVITEHSGIRIQFEDFYMCDVLKLQVLLEPNNTFNVPEDIKPDETIISVDAGCTMKHRTGSALSANTVFTADMVYINASVIVTQDASCKETLGMEHSSYVKDCQLSASIENPSEHPPSHGRMDGGTQAWQPFIRKSSFSKFRFFGVYWGNKTLIDKFVIQQGPGSFQHQPTELEIAYSDDGKSWNTEETVAVPVASPFTNFTFHPKRPTVARYVRIYITKDNSNGNPPDIGLRFGFFGCHKSFDKTPEDVCKDVTTTVTPKGFYWRSFLVTPADTAFICDTNQAKNMDLQCVRMNGNNVKQLDSQIGSMMGFDKKKNRVFAYNKNRQTTMVSHDAGDTWGAVDINDFHDARDNTAQFTAAVNVPFAKDKLMDSTPHADYTSLNYGAKYDGIYKNNGGLWNLVLNWHE